MAFWRLYYHLVWATKNREPLISSEIESRLYGYLALKAAELDVIVYAINGWRDHVHVLAAIPPKQSIADIVKQMKGSSARYLNKEVANGSFGWQRGYGALSLGQHQRPQAEAYVRNQKQHHQEHTDQRLLEYCIELDEGPAVPQHQETDNSAREEIASYNVDCLE